MKTYELSHQKNIRDLGGLVGFEGKTIKYNCFYRGGSLHKVNEEDIKILISFHLTDMVDFRGEDEFINQPDVKLIGVAYHNFPAIEERIKKEDVHNDDGNLLWFVSYGKSGFEHMKQQYKNLINDKKSQIAYRNFFKLLQKDNKAVYFHCSQGKDRAGLASYFIETILGVSGEDKIKDYLYSNIAMEKRVKKILSDIQYKSFYNEEYHQKLLDVFAAKIEYLQGALEEMENNYGGIMNYIKDVLEVDIDRFRELYLQ